MPRAKRVCSTPGCPELTDTGRCPACRLEAERKRGTARQRGYDRRHENTFRHQVLLRDPLCVCRDESHPHGPQCLAPSLHADHHPRDRQELVRLGLDPYDPQFGRGTCGPCHSRSTAALQPGGWATTNPVR